VYWDTYCCAHYTALTGHPHMMHLKHSNSVPHDTWETVHSGIYMTPIRATRGCESGTFHLGPAVPPRRVEPSLRRPTLSPLDCPLAVSPPARPPEECPVLRACPGWYPGCMKVCVDMSKQFSGACSALKSSTHRYCAVHFVSALRRII